MTLRAKPGVTLLAFLCLCTPGAIAAEKEPKVSFEFGWQIEPQKPNDEVLQLKEGQIVTSARLLPLQLLVTRSDVKTAEGKTLVTAGSELVRASTKTTGLLIACTITSVAVGPVESFLFTDEKFGCFVDDDLDGSFDRFFTRRSDMSVGVLTNYEVVPKKTIALHDARYEMADRRSTKYAPTLVFRYTNFAFLSKWILFQGCVRTYDDSACPDLATNYGVRLRELPGTFNAFGGSFEVLEKNDAGIKVRMMRPFSTQVVSFS